MVAVMDVVPVSTEFVTLELLTVPTFTLVEFHAAWLVKPCCAITEMTSRGELREATQSYDGAVCANCPRLKTARLWSERR